MSDTCCVGCFSDPFLRAVVSQRGIVTAHASCSWCGCAGHPSLELAELAAMFRKVVRKLHIRHSSIPHELDVDPLDGDMLGDAMGDSFSGGVKDRNALATALVNADWDFENGDDAFSASDTIWHSRAILGDIKYDENHPLTVEDAPFEDLAYYYYRILTDALQKYGHSLDADGRCGSESEPLVIQAVEALRSEFAKHIYCLPVESVLYRARIEQTTALKDFADVLAPPARLARSGRVNLAGQRVLYAASSQGTAIAEVRPALGDRVVVGTFVLQKSLRILDLTNAPHHELIRFEATDVSTPHNTRLGPDAWWEHLRFRKVRHELGRLFGKPVRPSDTDQDYLPTQFVARIVQHMKLDGIAYPSSQSAQAVRPGINYAFFNPFVAIPDELWTTKVNHVHVEFESLERINARLTSPSNAD